MQRPIASAASLPVSVLPSIREIVLRGSGGVQRVWSLERALGVESPSEGARYSAPPTG